MTGAAMAAPLQKVTYLLPAPEVLPSFAPWILARHKGYYKAAGLDVDFQRAKGGVDAAKQVGLGNADFAGAIGDTTVIVRANGIPVKAVALLGGGPLMIIAARADQGIKSPADLRGKTVSVVSYQDTTFYALQGSLAKFGISKNDLDIQAAGPRMVYQLVADGKAQACACSPDWVAFIEQSGTKLTLFPASQYFPTMAPAILASDKIIAARPDMVRGLVQATLRAMGEIMKDPQAAAREYVQAVPSYKGKEAEVGRILTLWTRLTYPGQKVLGEMQEDRFRALEDYYFKTGLIRKKSADPKLYFTNQFLARN